LVPPKIKVRIKLRLIGREEREIKVRKGIRIIDLLRRLKINPETVVVRKNKEVCIEEERIEEGDYIEIISVISGG
jgi:sulfur carrier protein